MSTQRPEAAASSTLSTPDEVFEPGFQLGRYEILRHVGSGGMGVVYQARDTERGTVVALKTLHRMDPGALLRLKDEFRFIANVTHPNLVSLHELVAVDGRWFFTMEYIDGEDLWARLRRAVLEKANPLFPVLSNDPTWIQAPRDDTAISLRESAQGMSAIFGRDSNRDATDVSVGDSGMHLETADGLGSGGASERAPRPLLPPVELRTLFRQVALAVDALHSARKLHGDIKPRNIMIGRDGRVVLLDFSLAKNLAEPVPTELAGTPAYIAPEQIAGLPVSEASDWYSFGATLYEALTGRRACTRARLRKEKAPRDPPNLPSSPDIPEDLRTLCLALLAREPSQRPKGQEVLARLGHDAGAQLGPLPRAAGLVGREEHLAALWDAYTTLRTQGRTVVVHVHGLSGSGRTVLVQRFLTAIGEQRDAIVLGGRCFERESVPYKAFDPLIDSLTRYLKTLTSIEMKGLMPQQLPELLCLFPVLRHVDAFAAVEPTPMDSGRDPQELRHRAFRGLKELLLLLSRKTHLVLHIDDLHWGDEDSTLALGELLEPPGAPRMLLLCGYRTAEGEAEGLLEAHRERDAVLEEPLDVREVVLGPLSESESRQLAALLLQAEEGDPRVSAIAREAHGIPFFIEELVQHMRSKGAGRPLAQGLALRADAPDFRGS